MRCASTRTAPFHVDCIFPETAREVNGLSVQFNPDNGPQRLVVGCTLQDGLDCYHEAGFTTSLKDSTHAEITLPENFIHESGTFSCQIPGLSIDEITTCRWPPQENVTHFIPELSQSGNGVTNGMVAGVAVGVVLCIVIFAIVFLVLYKKLPAFRRRLTFLGRGTDRSRGDIIVVMDGNNSPQCNDQPEQEKISVNKSEQTNCKTETPVSDYSSNEPLLSSDESLTIAPRQNK
ncbi:hypothetical protein C0Q70_12553 [Pomacea canaliculata]|uniref:Uncharacterized protein n=1 Tax=Pomacea canaliculata TaxID=400727 RepID=A0A2T7P1T9_POMCA|nr:uncharacterized protein LOC112569064 [Pomacea canaliculata]XP_025102502.1 uncharacterized protein LOC112569064 [Pomacea canaliculata]XP_025102503.1 uncharacterized protein LOC112569064 [Pomacea canaliculata]PVD27395.1 hypothetical protein C0Q70_12553 [Pomacea canaliculata]